MSQSRAISAWALSILGAAALFAAGGVTPPGPADQAIKIALPAPVQDALAGGGGRALTLAAADFDGDGITDLVSGYDTGGQGRIVLHRGDPAEASAFKPDPDQFDLSTPPDFLTAGDFDNDGYMDVLAAARGGQAIYLMRGDGHGGLSKAQPRELSGSLLKLAGGEINRPDGLADFAVAVVSPDGSDLQVFESPLGAWRAEPEVFALKSTIADLALGDLDGDLQPDLAAIAGDGLVVVHGRDRRLSLGTELRAKAAPARLEEIQLAFKAAAIAINPSSSRGDSRLSIKGDDGLVRRARSIVALPEAVGVDPEPGQAPDRAGASLRIRLGADAMDSLVSIQDNPAALSIVKPLPLTTFTVTNTNDAGAGSLRDAITRANATPGSDLIRFNIPGAPPYVISPASPLPDVTDPVRIDATTQPGFAGAPIVQLNGAGAGPLADGLVILPGASSVQGLVIRGFSGNGIRLKNGGGNVIAGNYLGTDVTGSVAVGNQSDGVFVEDSALNTIGGTTAAARNVISGNAAHGVLIASGPGGIATYTATDVPKLISDFTTTTSSLPVAAPGVVTDVDVTLRIAHSYDGDLRITVIGPDGTRVDLSLNNGGSGGDYNGTVFDDSGTVPITSGSAPFASPPSYIPQSPLAALIGTPAGGVWKLEVADTAAGDQGELRAWSIRLATAPAYGNQVQGNLIGTNAAGTASLGNVVDGILIANSPSNVVGGTTALHRNIISGNGSSGVELSGPGSAKNTIQGNYIGTNITGTAALTQKEGIVAGSDLNLIGGTAAGAGNVVSGNGGNVFEVGVHVLGNSNVVQGNKLGTDPTGTASVPNYFAGVQIENSTLNTIGGGVAGAGNLISGNTLLGVVLGYNCTQSFVQRNLIGTDVTGMAALGNGTAGINVIDSPNNRIGGIQSSEGNVISGNLGNGISLTKINSLVGSNLVEGNYIGTSLGGSTAIGNGSSGVTISTTFNTVGGVWGSGRGNVISGNGYSGVAIEYEGQFNTLLGNIIGLGSGGNALPNASDGVTVNGFVNTIGEAVANGGNIISANAGAGIHFIGFPDPTVNTYSSFDVPRAIADLSTMSSFLFLSQSNIPIDVNVTVNLSHTFDADLRLTLIDSLGRRFRLSDRHGASGDNFANTMFDDEGALPIASGSAPFSSPPSYVPDDLLAPLDGHALGLMNLEVADLASGDVGTLNSWSLTLTEAQLPGGNNVVIGNLIGTDLTGAQAISNQGPGILIEDGAGNRIGNPNYAPNVISGNRQEGIRISGAMSVGNQMVGNLIGTAANGISPLGNVSDGIRITNGASSNRLLDLFSPGPPNTIAFNGGAGVRVESGRCNNLRPTVIHDNGGLGIDLHPAGVTPNDPGDGDAGPNDVLNFPAISVQPSFGNTLVGIAYNSLPNMRVDFDFYDNTAPDPTGFGEGQNPFSGIIGLTTDASGNISQAVLVGGLHDFVTVTAVDSCGNTSEFSEVARTVLEASPAKDMTVTRVAGGLKVNYTPACGATDHVIYWGLEGPFMIGPPGLSWIGAACGMGVSGTALFDPGLPYPGFAYYFVIVGQNGTVEGSYGQDSLGAEEPEAVLPVVCDRPQYLGGICH